MRERNAPPPGNQPQPDVREALSLAAACAKRGDLEAAIVHLKELLGVAPDHEIANGMLAGIYAELKMPERATACYERVLVTNPRNVLARFQLGLLQLTGGRPQEALETLRPNLSDSTEFLAHFYSGLALLELNKTGEARVLLQRAAQRMPADHPLYPQLQGLLEPRRS
jgi:tetratricopeptide (TPR) repeat protein